MADPWTDDLAALGDATRHQLRSLAATRAHVFSRSQEKPRMRFFKLHPVLSAVLALGLVGAVGGGAYAVSHVYIDVDPDQTVPEIESSVGAQLAAQHVPGVVHAEKTDSAVSIKVEGGGPALDNLALRNVGTARTDGAQIQIEARCDLTDDQFHTLTDVIAPLTDKPTPGETDAQAVAAVTAALAAHGFTATVTGTTTSLQVIITSFSAP